MRDLVISGDLLDQLQLSSSELVIDFAIYLYDKGKLTLGQAKKLAGLSQTEIQKEMYQRGVLFRYDSQDLEQDLETLNTLQNHAHRE